MGQDADPSSGGLAVHIDGDTSPYIAKVAALEKLLADPQFRASDRNRRFLRFVVEESLAGRADRIKSFSIAIDVFGRGANFDNRLDPIVRIEATRLRAALTAYYAGPGQNEPMQIQLPKGGYIPVFEQAIASIALPPDLQRAPDPDGSTALPRAQAENAQLSEISPIGYAKRYLLGLGAPLALLAVLAIGVIRVTQYEAAPVAQWPPVVIVEINHQTSLDDPDSQIGIGFARSVNLALTKFDGIRVMSLSPDLTSSAALEMLSADKAKHGTVYLLESGVRRQDQMIRFWWNLKDARSGETIWTDVADRSFSKGMTIPAEDEVAIKISTVMGQPLGLIANRELATDRVFPTDGYNCVLRARFYYLAISETLHREVRDCLEQTVAIAPDYAEAWAMLAWIYLDEDRNQFNVRTTAEDALNRALTSVQRAVELAPNSATAQEARMSIYYRKGDFDTAFAAGHRAIELSPHNPDLQASLGVRLFARGNWDEGAALVGAAFAQQLVISPLDRITLVLDSYRKGDYHAALEQAQLINLPHFYARPALLAAIYGQLDDVSEAQKNVQALLVLRPNFAAEMRADLRSRHYTEPLIDMFAEGLKKAGLTVQ